MELAAVSPFVCQSVTIGLQQKGIIDLSEDLS